MNGTKLRVVVLIPILLALAVAAGAADVEFDPDRALRDPAFSNALKSIRDEDAASKAFEQHGVRAFGISNQLVGFLNELAGGQYTTQIRKIMDVPVQQWNANRGMYGSYDIVNVKQWVNQNQTSSLFGRVQTTMGHVATAVSCIQVGRDIAKGLQGDDPSKLNALHGTYNVLVGYWIKELSWKSLGTAMMGVGVVSTALTEFQAEAVRQYEDYWWIAYTNYMETSYPKLVTGADSWAAVAKTQGHAAVRSRLYSFWDDPYTNAGSNYGKASIQTSPALAQRTMSDKFAALYYRNSVHRTLKTYFRLEAEKAEAAAWIEGRREWMRLQTMLTQAEALRLAILDASDMGENGPVRDFTVSAGNGPFYEGESITFTATVVFEDEREIDVTALCEWSNHAPGGVIAKAQGGTESAEATYGENTVTGVVSVSALTDLAGSPNPAQLKPGEDVTFSVTATWDDGTTRDVSAEVEWPGELAGGHYEGSLEPQTTIWDVSWKGASTNVAAEVMPPAAVNVVPAAVQLKPGGVQTFTAEAVYETGESIDVSAEATWSGDGDGDTFTGDSIGLFHIDAEYMEAGGMAQIEVTGPDDLIISPAGAELKLGETVTFTASAAWPDGTVEDVTGQIDWGADAPGGVFTAREEGLTVFDAVYYGEQLSIRIRVVGPADLTLAPASATIRMNETVSFTATAVYQDGTTDDATALVEFSGCTAAGLFTPERTGAATVTARYGELTSSATVEVTGPDQLFLEPGESTIEAGEQVAFTANAHFPDGSTDDVTAAAAYVNAPGGVFSGTATGSHTVTATYGGLSASATVEVEQGATLTISPASAECEVNGTATFTAELVGPDGTREDTAGRVVWQGAVGGVFTGRLPGEAIVTASLGGLSATARVTVRDGDADVTLDDAVDEIGDETTDELCSAAELRAAAARVRGLLSKADAAYASFGVFSLKFNKELADRASDPCGNSLLAYCYGGAQRAAGELAAAREGIRAAATTLLAMQAWCPETAASSGGGFESQSLVSELAGLGADYGVVQGRLAAMAGRLGEYGCDENEFDQLGESITEDDMDPDLLQGGGGMQELPGDGVDNDNDGLQEENVEALSGYNVTIVVYDSGNLKDDVFHLSVSGVGSLGSTPAGGLRSYGMNLPAGSYTATVTVVAAPDNVGTFSIVVMENGEAIASGAGEPPAGSAYTLGFTVVGAAQE